MALGGPSPQRLSHLLLAHQFAERLGPVAPRDDHVLVRPMVPERGQVVRSMAGVGLAWHGFDHDSLRDAIPRPPKRAPRTRVHRLWLLLLRPDQIHGSPLRGAHFDGRTHPQHHTFVNAGRCGVKGEAALETSHHYLGEIVQMIRRECCAGGDSTFPTSESS